MKARHANYNHSDRGVIALCFSQQVALQRGVHRATDKKSLMKEREGSSESSLSLFLSLFLSLALSVLARMSRATQLSAYLPAFQIVCPSFFLLSLTFFSRLITLTTLSSPSVSPSFSQIHKLFFLSSSHLSFTPLCSYIPRVPDFVSLSLSSLCPSNFPSIYLFE